MVPGDLGLRLVLASASPRRRAILEQLGVAFDVRPADVEELGEGDPPAVALANARLKASAVSGDLVLGCDTLVALDGEIYGKPGSVEEARATLLALRGRTHTVWSGLVVTGRGERVVGTEVTFASFSEALLDWYLSFGEWEGKAGGYAIQGRGAALVHRVDGDFFNVVGLPVAALVELLGAHLTTPSATA